MPLLPLAELLLPLPLSSRQQSMFWERDDMVGAARKAGFTSTEAHNPKLFGSFLYPSIFYHGLTVTVTQSLQAGPIGAEFDGVRVLKYLQLVGRPQ
jgi:hypothetical protein